MTVGEIVAACEYINCVVLDAFGDEIQIALDDYSRTVEHVSAKDNVIQIWTFDKWEEFMNANASR